MTATATAARSLGNPSGGINNTAYLFFVLALAFIFYITIKGDLPKWLGLFGLGGKPTGSATASPAASTPATNSSTAPNVLGGAAPTYAALPALGQDSSTFGGGGVLNNAYNGPTFIDTSSGF